MLFFIFISGFLLSEQLKNFDKKKLISAFKINSIFFIFLGFLSLVLEIDLFNYSNLGKPVFPFSEPRHYVTATSGILLATSFYISNN